jgi:hypothetical protein
MAVTSLSERAVPHSNAVPSSCGNCAETASMKSVHSSLRVVDGDSIHRCTTAAFKQHYHMTSFHDVLYFDGTRRHSIVVHCSLQFVVQPPRVPVVWSRRLRSPFYIEPTALTEGVDDCNATIRAFGPKPVWCCYTYSH